MIIKPRGTMDILPEDTPIWQYIEEKVRRLAERYGYSEIRFPTFEATELFARGVGDTTDVVQKEMYTFFDKDDRSMTLRPEGTACVARSIVENGKYADVMPLKYYYIINCFRYEKPAAGRYREFFQFGAELYGAEGPSADASVIALADRFIRELGIKNCTLAINSIGCKDCRPAYRDALISYFSQHEKDLCDTCKNRLRTNPLRILDCKCPECQKIAENAPKTIDYLCPDCAEHMKSVKEMLDEAGIAFTVDTGIVRGLDYYSRTVFEFIGPTGEFDEDGAEKYLTLCGGGRYDGLIEEIGGPRLSGIGFGMGIARLIAAMRSSGVQFPGKPAPALYIASLGAAAQKKAFLLTEQLIDEGILCECDLVGRSLKAQMKYANKKNARYTAIIGDNEIENGRAVLRCMDGGEQTEVPFDGIAEFIKNRM